MTTDRRAASGSTSRTTPAVGGERRVPIPDAVASDYLLLALRLDQHIPGLVDAYFGPADLKAQVDLEQPRPASALADDAAMLRDRLATDVSDEFRIRWLEVQLVALEAQARALAGEDLPYLDHVTRCFDLRPSRHDDRVFRAIAADLDALLAGSGPLPERLAAADDAITLPPDRLPALAEWLVEAFRERAKTMFGLPGREALRIGFVRGQPWSGYNWYEGGLRSRVDLNLDLPIRAPDLIRVLAHETFPGHHLEHAWKEADLVDGHGWLEASIMLINTPECLVSEGLANLGHQFAVEPADEAALLAELLERGGVGAPEGEDAEAWAGRQVEIARLRHDLAPVGANAALMRHAADASHEDVLAYLVDVGLMSPDRAAKRLSFIEHPLWRTYVFVYSEGEALLARWLEKAPAQERVERFGRLLHEQVTPGGIAGGV